MQASSSNGFVLVGQVVGLFGVHGWMRVRSYTQPVGNILQYRPWWLNVHGQRREVAVQAGRIHDRRVVVQLEGYADRDVARSLLGADVSVRRAQLPPLERNQYYWTDLEGLRVYNSEGLYLGKVDHLIATGANDVLVVRGERERLIPFVRDRVVTALDLARGELTVDWGEDY